MAVHCLELGCIRLYIHYDLEISLGPRDGHLSGLGKSLGCLGCTTQYILPLGSVGIQHRQHFSAIRKLQMDNYNLSKHVIFVGLILFKRLPPYSKECRPICWRDGDGNYCQSININSFGFGFMASTKLSRLAQRWYQFKRCCSVKLFVPLSHPLHPTPHTLLSVFVTFTFWPGFWSRPQFFVIFCWYFLHFTFSVIC